MMTDPFDNLRRHGIPVPEDLDRDAPGQLVLDLGIPSWVLPPEAIAALLRDDPAPVGWTCPVCRRGVRPDLATCDHGGLA